MLEPGLTLFKLGHRFVHGRRLGDLEVVSSPWWFTRATVESICGAPTESGADLSDAFRRFGAVAKRWGGTGDLIVRATLRSDVVAFIGPGTVQDFRGDGSPAHDDAGDLPLWIPSASIPQVHVSLMPPGRPESSVAREAFGEIHIVPTDKWDDAYVHGDPGGRRRFA